MNEMDFEGLVEFWLNLPGLGPGNSSQNVQKGLGLYVQKMFAC